MGKLNLLKSIACPCLYPKKKNDVYLGFFQYLFGSTFIIIIIIFFTHFLFFETIIIIHAMQQHCPWDTQPLYSGKRILKMSPTVLFTHLKIILLQCFQFSVSATISLIQMNPLYSIYIPINKKIIINKFFTDRKYEI